VQAGLKTADTGKQFRGNAYPLLKLPLKASFCEEKLLLQEF